MKKTYLSPETILMVIATQKMIAASNPEGFNGTLDDTDANAISPDQMLSRRHNVWDDEFEEEEEF